MRFARSILVLFCLFMGGTAFSEEPGSAPASSILESIDGILKKVGRLGKTVTIEDLAGKKRQVDLPDNVRVYRRVSLSELKMGEWIHARFSSTGGRDEISIAHINRRSPAPQASAWDGRPLPSRPARYQGTVEAVDQAARRIAIARVDGEVRWFSLSERALFIAVGPPSILSEGDTVTVVFQGPVESDRPVLVQASSVEAMGRR